MCVEIGMNKDDAKIVVEIITLKKWSKVMNKNEKSINKRLEKEKMTKKESEMLKEKIIKV